MTYIKEQFTGALAEQESVEFTLTLKLPFNDPVAQEWIARATMVCQDRARAQAIAASCLAASAERGRVSPNWHDPADYRETAYRALLLGWEGTNYAEAERIVLRNSLTR